VFSVTWKKAPTNARQLRKKNEFRPTAQGLSQRRPGGQARRAIARLRARWVPALHAPSDAPGPCGLVAALCRGRELARGHRPPCFFCLCCHGERGARGGRAWDQPPGKPRVPWVSTSGMLLCWHSPRGPAACQGGPARWNPVGRRTAAAGPQRGIRAWACSHPRLSRGCPRDRCGSSIAARGAKAPPPPPRAWR